MVHVYDKNLFIYLKKTKNKVITERIPITSKKRLDCSDRNVQCKNES